MRNSSFHSFRIRAQLNNAIKTKCLQLIQYAHVFAIEIVRNCGAEGTSRKPYYTQAHMLCLFAKRKFPAWLCYRKCDRWTKPSSELKLIFLLRISVLNPPGRWTNTWAIARVNRIISEFHFISCLLCIPSLLLHALAHNRFQALHFSYPKHLWRPHRVATCSMAAL